jgi:hypothetical protein
MKIKQKIAKLEDAPEGARGFYETTDDGFTLKNEFEIEIPDVGGLTRNRDAILAEKNALEQKFAGLDPQLAREALLRVAVAEEKALGAEITSAFTAAGVRPGAEVFFKPFLFGDSASGRVPRVKIVDGKIQVLNEDGRTAMVDEKGAAVTMVGLVESFKKQDLFAPLFQATGAGGSGAPGGSSGAVGRSQISINRSAFEALPPAERMAHVKSGGSVTDN